MNSSKEERLKFWIAAEKAAHFRRSETQAELRTEKNTMRKEVLHRIAADDEARAKIAKDFIFMYNR